jgi:hypothetical protein
MNDNIINCVVLFILFLPHCLFIVHKGITREELNEELQFFSKRLKTNDESNMSNMKDSEFTKQVELLFGIPIEEICSAGDESILSEVQQKHLSQADIPDEHILIVHLTSTLSSLCREVGVTFVNSEEQKWIHTYLEHPVNFQKPDGCSSLPGLHTVGGSHHPELNPLRAQQGIDFAVKSRDGSTQALKTVLMLSTESSEAMVAGEYTKLCGFEDNHNVMHVVNGSLTRVNSDACTLLGMGYLMEHVSEQLTTTKCTAGLFLMLIQSLSR